MNKFDKETITIIERLLIVLGLSDANGSSTIPIYLRNMNEAKKGDVERAKFGKEVNRDSVNLFLNKLGKERMMIYAIVN